jgi:hypothetical protein
LGVFGSENKALHKLIQPDKKRLFHAEATRIRFVSSIGPATSIRVAGAMPLFRNRQSIIKEQENEDHPS